MPSESRQAPAVPRSLRVAPAVVNRFDLVGIAFACKKAACHQRQELAGTVNSVDCHKADVRHYARVHLAIGPKLRLLRAEARSQTPPMGSGQPPRRRPLSQSA